MRKFGHEEAGICNLLGVLSASRATLRSTQTNERLVITVGGCVRAMVSSATTDTATALAFRLAAVTCSRSVAPALLAVEGGEREGRHARPGDHGVDRSVVRRTFCGGLSSGREWVPPGVSVGGGNERGRYPAPSRSDWGTRYGTVAVRLGHIDRAMTLPTEF